ncbi:MAG: hypothetical protein V1763_02035, partial [Parcubacteria group bacterium]
MKNSAHTGAPTERKPMHSHKSESLLRELLDQISRLYPNIYVLIQNGKRSLSMIGELRKALQLFHDDKLGGAVSQAEKEETATREELLRKHARL